MIEHLSHCLPRCYNITAATTNLLSPYSFGALYPLRGEPRLEVGAVHEAAVQGFPLHVRKRLKRGRGTKGLQQMLRELTQHPPHNGRVWIVTFRIWRHASIASIASIAAIAAIASIFATPPRENLDERECSLARELSHTSVRRCLAFRCRLPHIPAKITSHNCRKTRCFVHTSTSSMAIVGRRLGALYFVRECEKTGGKGLAQAPYCRQTVTGVHRNNNLPYHMVPSVDWTLKS